MLKDVLVKPLEPVMVTKEITEQIPTGEVDEDGFNKYDTQTETKEVESEYSTGVVLKIPTCLTECEYKVGQFLFKKQQPSQLPIGDTIVYNKKFAKDFDLFKDSQLVKPYDIIAVSNMI